MSLVSGAIGGWEEDEYMRRSIAKLAAEVSKLQDELSQKNVALEACIEVDTERKQLMCLYSTRCDQLNVCSDELAKVVKESAASEGQLKRTAKQLEEKKGQLKESQVSLEKAQGLLRANDSQLVIRIKELSDEVERKGEQLKESQKLLEESQKVDVARTVEREKEAPESGNAEQLLLAVVKEKEMCRSLQALEEKLKRAEQESELAAGDLVKAQLQASTSCCFRSAKEEAWV